MSLTSNGNTTDVSSAALPIHPQFSKSSLKDQINPENRNWAKSWSGNLFSILKIFNKTRRLVKIVLEFHNVSDTI